MRNVFRIVNLYHGANNHGFYNPIHYNLTEYEKYTARKAKYNVKQLFNHKLY